MMLVNLVGFEIKFAILSCCLCEVLILSSGATQLVEANDLKTKNKLIEVRGIH